MCMRVGIGVGVGVGVGMSVGVSVSVSMGMRMRVSKGKSCRIGDGPWRVTPLIALKFKSWLYSISVCGHCMRKADSS